MFQRLHFQLLAKRIQEPRKFIQVLMGPRQVGKTTLVTQLTAALKISSYFVSADAVPASNKVWLEQQWESARLNMNKEGALEALLVIDEIQKIDNWSETVKLLWDADTKNKLGLKIILLGSSRLLLQQGLTESLAGRFETTYMGHWSFAEMKEAFGWNAEQYVWFGGYPGSAPEDKSLLNLRIELDNPKEEEYEILDTDLMEALAVQKPFRNCMKLQD